MKRKAILSVFLFVLLIVLSGCSERKTFSGSSEEALLSGEEAFQRGFPADGGEFAQKADLTEIDAEKRNVQPGKLAAHADEGSVAAEDQDCVGGAGPADEFFGRAVGGKGGTSHTVGFEPLADGCCGGFGGGVPGLGDEKYGGDGVHLLSVVESL